MTKIIGRAAECRTLDQVVDRVRTGLSTAVVVRGEAGVGKSALLRRLAEEADGLRVISVTAVEPEMFLGYAALHQVLRPFLDRLDRLAPPQRRALGVAFGLSEGAEPNQFLVGLATLTLLSEAAAQEPMLCVIDDAQWLDRETAEVLGIVARRLYADGFSIIAAVREPTEQPVLAGLPEIMLHGLPVADARELVARSALTELDVDVTERIVRETHGNPLGLIELSRGVTRDQREALVGEPLPLGQRLEARFLAQVRMLPSEAQLCLLVAAAEPGGDLDLLHRVAHRLGEPPSGFDLAAKQGLLSLTPPVSFRHPLVRSAVYHGASVVERRRVHLALAEAGATVLAEDRVAWHHAAAVAGPDEGVAAELEQVARHVSRRGGHSSAAALLARSAELTGAPGPRASRLVAAADAHFTSGAAGQARVLLDRAAPQLTDGFERARALRLRAGVDYALGDMAETLPSMLRAARELQPYDVALARQTLYEALGAATNRGGYLTDFTQVAQAIRDIRPAEGPPSDQDRLLDRFADFFLHGPAAGTAPLRGELIALLERAQDTHGDLRLHGLSCVIATVLADFDLSERLAARWIEAARRENAYIDLSRALFHLAVFQWHRGMLDAAENLIVETSEIEIMRGARVNPGEVQLLAVRGDEKVRQVAPQLIEESLRRGQIWAGMFAHWGMGVLELGLGHYEEALAHLRVACPAESVWPPNGSPDLVEAAVRAQDLDTARAALDHYAVRAEAGGTPLGLGLLARCRALAATGEEAEAHYQHSIARLESAGSPLQLARSRLLYGEWLRRRRRRGAARTHLQAARQAFGEVGAAAFAERARNELNASGLRVDRQETRAASGLTPQERQIAVLASRGGTNREIGARMFISPNTVDYHLRKIFRKFGITSRRELADLPLD